MDLTYTAADLAFRDTVRAFLDANLPSDLQKKVRKGASHRAEHAGPSQKSVRHPL